MKLSKTMKKFMTVVCTLALVVSSLTVNNFAKADDGTWAFTSTSYQTNAEKTQYNITVNYSAYQGANPDEYYYSVYIGEEADGNIGIASNGWNWGKDKGRHLFDTVYKTLEGEAFKPGETLKVIVVVYEKNEDESFTRLDSIETEITLPSELPTFSQEEQEKKDMEDACVSDENLAKGTTGFVSWNEDPAPALVDGNLGSGTGNSSVKGENDFVGVNLGEVKTIGSIITKFESACPAEFAVYVAGADGVYGDTPVATNTAAGANPIVKTTFTAVEAQYVKVVQTVPSGLSTAYGMNAFELAVFAGEKVPETTTPEVVETTTPEVVETTTPEVVETTTPAESDTTKDDEPEYDPGFDPAALTYQDMACEGGETLGYALQNSTIAGVVPYYENSGNTFSVMFSGDAGMVTAITVNGQEPDEGVVIEKATGVVRINPTKFADNAYTVVTATAESGQLTFVVKKGTPEVVETTTPEVVETTTPEVVETTTPEVVETTTPEVVETTTPDAGETTTPDAGETTTPDVVETTTQPATTVAPTTTTTAPKVTTTKKDLGKTTVQSASKKKTATKVKITFKKVKGAKKYQVQIAKNKRFKKVLVKKTVKKVKVTIKSKKLKNQKTLYVRVRAVGAKKWSKPKKIKIKK